MSYVIWLVFFFLVIMTAGVIYILRIQRARRKIISDKTLFLRENGQKLKVDFTVCNVVHREYYAEDKKGEKIAKDISIITFQTDAINGKMTLFKTPPVFLPEDNLRVRIHAQKSTIIYYNPSDTGIYYFDIEFLLSFMVEAAL
jgi:hypothetical protein